MRLRCPKLDRSASKPRAPAPHMEPLWTPDLCPMAGPYPFRYDEQPGPLGKDRWYRGTVEGSECATGVIKVWGGERGSPPSPAALSPHPLPSLPTPPCSNLTHSPPPTSSTSGQVPRCDGRSGRLGAGYQPRRPNRARGELYPLVCVWGSGLIGEQRLGSGIGGQRLGSEIGGQRLL